MAAWWLKFVELNGVPPLRVLCWETLHAAAACTLI